MEKSEERLELRDDPGDEGSGLLAESKRLARQRVDDDRRRSPEELGPVFEALATRMFDPGFNARAAIPDSAARRQFRLAVGMTPRAYRDHRRLKTAILLVRETELPILEIAAGLGFEDPELFTKWFKWRTGVSPMAMRSPPGSEPAPQPEAATTVGEPWTDRDCRQAAALGVRPERGAALIRKLLEVYPELEDEPILEEEETSCSTSSPS